VAHYPSIDCPPTVNEVTLLECLSRVQDPELDESIVDLGFVQAIRLRDREASVTLRLPTSWCAINFAFVMAEDVRSALLAADGIDRVTVRLGDHCAAADIEEAVNNGKPFVAAFPHNGGRDLAALRTIFLRKGFLIRQERLLRELLTRGLSMGDIAQLNIGTMAVGRHEFRPEIASLPRYLERRAELGLDCSSHAALVVDQEGAAVLEERLEQYFQRIRTVRVAMEANASICRAALASRNNMNSGRQQ